MLGYKNTIKYANKLKLKIFKNLNKFDNKSSDLKETIEYIMARNKWTINTNIYKILTFPLI